MLVDASGRHQHPLWGTRTNFSSFDFDPQQEREVVIAERKRKMRKQTKRRKSGIKKN